MSKQAPSLAAALLLAGALAGLWAHPAPAAERSAESPQDDGGAPTLDVSKVAPETAAHPAIATLSLDQVQAGQTGYGLSVFSGSEPERFDVEVIGVWQNNSLEMSYLLAKLSGKDLQRSGVLAGMSGSPVYIDDKLVGAVAFSFTFGLDPIAGITPIDAMRELSGATGGLLGTIDRPPIVPLASPVALPSVQQLASGEFLSSDPEELRRTLTEGLRLLRPTGADGISGGRTAVTWTAGGFPEPAAELLRAQLGVVAVPSMLPALRSVATGSVSAAVPGSVLAPAVATGVAESPADLQPGDAVSLVLMRGDLNLAAHGTVTDRWGDEIVAFGHPIYSLGPTRFPMAESHVVTTIANVASSFKLSNQGRLLGVFDQDREAGTHGVLGARPQLMPLAIRLRGLVERDYAMELADAPLFRPTLLAVGLLGALTSGSYATGFQGYDLTATFRFHDRDDLVLRHSFDGANAAMECVVYLLTFSYFLEFNELGELDLASVDLEVAQSDRPRVTEIVRAHAERSRVEPGESVGVWLDLQPFRGEPERRRIEVTVPDDLPAGRYYVMIADGNTADSVRLQVRRTEPETLDQTLDMLRDFHSNRELHVVGLAAGRGLAVGGTSLPGLPGSVRGLYAGARVGQEQRLRIVDEAILPSDRPLSGVVRVDLEVQDPPT